MIKLLLSLVLCISANIQSQDFNLSAEIRPRFENKHGYSSLLDTNNKGSNFISQRTRLNFHFKNESLKIGISTQNTRIWGDVSTLSKNDNATMLHEAWAEAILSPKLSFKIGRQEIVYDDQRIFGNVGWAQQGRSHDAFLIKYRPSSKTKMDVGLALNSDSESGKNILYSNVAGYKDFQYLWFHRDFKILNLSFLILNTGVEYLKN